MVKIVHPKNFIYYFFVYATFDFFDSGCIGFVRANAPNNFSFAPTIELTLLDFFNHRVHREDTENTGTILSTILEDISVTPVLPVKEAFRQTLREHLY